jgi:hypothetical protein
MWIKFVLLAISISIIHSNSFRYTLVCQNTGSISYVNLYCPLSIVSERCLDLSNQRAHCAWQVGLLPFGRNWFHGGKGGRIKCQKLKQYRILGLAKSTSIFIAFIALGNRDIPQIVCILRAGRPRKLSLIPGRCKRYFLFWTACILARSPTQGVSMGNGDNLAVSKAARA